jgi:hypothetical protein
VGRSKISIITIEAITLIITVGDIMHTDPTILVTGATTDGLYDLTSLDHGVVLQAPPVPAFPVRQSAAMTGRLASG